MVNRVYSPLNDKTRLTPIHTEWAAKEILSTGETPSLVLVYRIPSYGDLLSPSKKISQLRMLLIFFFLASSLLRFVNIKFYVGDMK